jgi:hypothetical protein
MRLLVTINGVDAMIVGYVSVDHVVNAVVVMNGTLCAVELEAVRLGRLPKPLRAKVKRRARKIAATEHAAQAH